MKVNFGGSRQSLKNYERQLEEALNFFSGKLFVDRKITSEIVVDVDFFRDTESLTSFGITLEADAYTNIEDREIDPRWFTINLNGCLSIDDMIKNLAHEMVHVKQFALNEIQVFDNCLVRWHNTYIHTKKVDYWDLPWEIEAYGRETGLYIRYQANQGNKAFG